MPPKRLRPPPSMAPGSEAFAVRDWQVPRRFWVGGLPPQVGWWVPPRLDAVAPWEVLPRPDRVNCLPCLLDVRPCFMAEGGVCGGHVAVYPVRAALVEWRWKFRLPKRKITNALSAGGREVFASKQLMEDVRERKLNVNVKHVHHENGTHDNRFTSLRVRLAGPHNAAHARARCAG